MHADSYNRNQQQAETLAHELFALFRPSSVELLGPFESFVNNLASEPTEFSRTFSEYRVQLGLVDGVAAAKKNVRLTNRFVRDTYSPIRINQGN